MNCGPIGKITDCGDLFSRKFCIYIEPCKYTLATDLYNNILTHRFGESRFDGAKAFVSGYDVICIGIALHYGLCNISLARTNLCILLIIYIIMRCGELSQPIVINKVKKHHTEPTMMVYGKSSESIVMSLLPTTRRGSRTLGATRRGSGDDLSVAFH
ncbi:hypothetical protein ACJX0J_029291, partial [Zea mays]